MANYRMKAEGYGAAATVAPLGPAPKPQNVITDDEWQRAAINLGGQPAGLSNAEWTLRLHAEVRRLRAAAAG